MLTTNEEKVESVYVVRPEGWDDNRRWILDLGIREGVMTTDVDDGEEEHFDFQRTFCDDSGFMVYALCKYTNELEFTHGAYVYAWEVYLQNANNSDVCYYCESFSLDERDDEAERYEIFRIADFYANVIAEQLEDETTEKCPHQGEEFHDEINAFLDDFLSQVFGEEK